MTPNPNLKQRQVSGGATTIKNNSAKPTISTPQLSSPSKDNQEGPRSQEESKIINLLSYLFFWSEKYDEDLQKGWNKLPKFVGSFLASVAVFLFGISAKGEWMIFAVYFFKYIQTSGSITYKEESDQLIDSTYDWFNVRFEGFWTTWFWSTLVSYVFYFGIGGFLHWYYYVRLRDRPEEWKCQPKKWLSPELERHEIMVGSLSLVFGSAISAVLSSYVKNGGKAIWMYVDPAEYGYTWLILQIPIVFMYQDYVTYWHHRMYHTPFLYKHFHKLHHTYKQPTAFSVTAIHPVEFVHIQLAILSSVVIMPVYWLNFAIIAAYVYYHGIIDHSGINFKRHWWQPWQPDCIFHDNHHQYFHVNFGFNIRFWDVLHGTQRRTDRIYRENIYYGQGKSLEEATAEELKEEAEERESENPKAYQGNVMGYRLDKKGITNE